MFDKLQEMADRLTEIDELILDPEVIAQHQRYSALMKERGRLVKLVNPYEELKTAEAQLAEAREVAENKEEDAELREMAEDEIPGYEETIATLKEKLEELLLTEDEDSARNAIMEIRAGAGGDEAAIFAGDLFGMYSRYAETKGWKVSIMDQSESEMGGYKYITCSIEGDDVFKHLRYESGGHRVQRVPATESQGRIHTSLCTVAVLPEAQEVEVDIRKDDLDIGYFRASGPGGQHVNKTSSAVRIVHVPSGVVVECQSERSQHQNREHAMRMLASRLYEAKMNEQKSERDQMRKSQIGSGDRSEKIRTYNYPQSRITDHRAGITVHNLEGLMQGDMNSLIEQLMEWDKLQKLKNLGGE
jgi:peptide chain release factor 1